MATIDEATAAVIAAIHVASGLASGLVYYNDQPIDRPASMYVTVRPTSDTNLGFPGNIRSIPTSGRPAGEEVEIQLEDDSDLSLSVQIWNGPTVTRTGAPSAFSFAKSMRSKLFLPTALQVFMSAGVSLIDVGSVQNLGRLLGARFEGRAQFDVRVYYRAAESEFTTNIESLAVTNVGTGEVLTLPLP